MGQGNPNEQLSGRHDIRPSCRTDDHRLDNTIHPQPVNKEKNLVNVIIAGSLIINLTFIYFIFFSFLSMCLLLGMKFNSRFGSK